MEHNMENQSETEGMEIAIIGMAGRFPGAKDVNEFWENLKNGIESISFFKDEEIDTQGIDPDLIENPQYVKAGGVLEGAEYFDASFFGFYPGEAEILDPQHRIFLECAWEALEDAGYVPDEYPGWVGLFAGSGMNTYLIYNLISNHEIMDTVHGYQLTISNDKDFMPTRVSYKLNLRGPSVNIQSACSTSLVATHLACQSLLNYQCDMALSGGVTIRLPQKQGYLYQEGGIASPDGHCRAFDEDAQGTVGGNGVGIVVLKRLADAIADGDHIYAVIKGSAINNDGSLKVGYTAPSIEGQAEVIATAQAVADVDPETISYIETHGTGTSLGDPIEIAALTQVFQANSQKTGYCRIGSVKTNVGHLDAAAGVTSLIKTALSLKNGQIPPSLNFSKPNPKIDFGKTPFIVNTELTDWESDVDPLRAGVSSFGIGGTNAHVILEESPRTAHNSDSREWQMLMVSAKTPEALQRKNEDLLNYLKNKPEEPLADIAYTLQVGRKDFNYRNVVLCRDSSEAISGLSGEELQYLLVGETDEIKRQVVFMFTGQGAQYVHMAQGLYENEPVFKDSVDRCAQILGSYFENDLRNLLYPTIYSNEVYSAERAADILKQTNVTQPALFVIEYSLAKLLISWGISPAGMIGHSIGEYVAATLAGVFPLETALEIVSIRGSLMQSLPSGSMVSVSLSEEEIQPYLSEGLSLAAVNTPLLCVISGPTDKIEGLISILTKEGIVFRRLHTSHAFHSMMMEPILDEFKRRVSEYELLSPKVPFISNLTGTWIKPEEATSPDYWCRHLRETVRFADGVSQLLKDKSNILLEVGPGRTLTMLAKGHSAAEADLIVLSTIRHPQDQQDDNPFLLFTLSKLWLAGIRMNWEGFYSNEKRMRVSLPTYPFERTRYWISPDSSFATLSRRNVDVKKHKDINKWFYQSSWKRQNLLRFDTRNGIEQKPVHWMVFQHTVSSERNSDLAVKIINHLTDINQDVIVVNHGSYQKIDNNKYSVDFSNYDEFAKLFSELSNQGWVPERILFFADENLIEVENYPPKSKNAIISDFWSLTCLGKALGKSEFSVKMKIITVTSGLSEVTGSENLSPINSLLMGPGLVIPQEYPNISCKTVDFIDSLGDDIHANRLIDSLLGEFEQDSVEPLIAYRGYYRWSQVYEERNIPITDESRSLVKKNGTYLITGGLGRIGLTFARYLAEHFGANLVLVDRYDLPERTEWSEWFDNHGDQNPVSLRMQRIFEIEELGGTVTVIRANSALLEEMEIAFQSAVERFGYINGIIHAAGFVGEESIRTIEETSLDHSLAHFESKVFGTIVLAILIERNSIIKNNLDFILLQSSLSAILGGLGYVSYSAANNFLDVFSFQQSKLSNIPWISVDWDGWNFGNENINARTNQVGNLMSSAIVDLSMTPEEGLKVFERVVVDQEDIHLIVSTADLDQRIAQWVRRENKVEPEELESKSSLAKHSRPKLQTPLLLPRNEIESDLVDMWEKVLRIQGIGVLDDFFELGGHSLLATQMVTRLRDRYQIDFPLRRLFETPNIAGLARIIEEARNDRTEKIDHHIPIVSRENPIQLSYGQLRLWFLEQLEPNSPLYNNFAAVKMVGDLDLQVFEKSLYEIVRRHEALRTSFVEIQGEPYQIISEDTKIIFNFIDLSTFETQTKEQTWKKLAVEEARKPFSLSELPLFRVSVLKLDDKENLVFLTTHHIVSDGWSVNVFIYEIGTIYTAFLEGKPIPLPELPIQYPDFSVWQRSWLQGEVTTTQMNYWRDQLKGIPSHIDLLTDHPRPSVMTSKGSNEWFDLSEQLSAGLLELSKQNGVTLFMVLLAALKTMLYRYTSQEDIVIGTPIANRNQVEVEGLIGFLLNTLVLRTDMSNDPSFNELLTRVKANAFGAYAHQDLPFEMLVDAIQPERDMSRTPIFQVIFDLQDATQQELNLPGVTISPVKVDTGTAKFDIALSMEDHGTYLNGYFNFNSDLFEPATIQRMKEHFINILEAVVENPNQHLSQLPMISKSELDQVLLNRNIIQIDLLPFEDIINLFQSCARSFPEKTAILLSNNQLSYEQLDQQSNWVREELAHQIVSGQAIGCIFERSMQAITGILGIWKSGGVYLPIDPSTPLERMNFILNDADVKMILTQESLVDTLFMKYPELTSGRQLFVIEDILVNSSTQDITQNEAQHHQIDPEDVAYIIYTSGTTGKPKGVMVSHRSIADHIRVMVDHFGILPEDRVLQFSAFSFDQSIEQILVTLVSGASLYLRGQEIWDPAQFSDIISENQLSVVNIQPAYWQQWMMASITNKRTIPLDTLRLVIIGGDVILPEMIRLWNRTPMQNAKLLNAYGPTETTITASTYEIKFNKLSEDGYFRVPIGQPLPNRKFFVLDRFNNPTPIGVPGELYIAGAGLAIGYLNQPELTDEKFVYNSPGLSENATQRMYRTGDLVRYLPSGDIEFLGRVDLQVKLRGFRIELGEIEEILNLHPEVLEAVVLVRTDEFVKPQSTGTEEPSEKKLVAYIIMADSSPKIEEKVNEIRTFLKDRLPAYMIPTGFFVLDKFPLLPSGKVDRKSLGKISDSTIIRPLSESNYVSPRTPVEQELVEMWQEILGIEKVGVFDNFFELGGHSLLATRIVSRIREIYQIELPLRNLFESPTIATLSTTIAQGLAEQEVNQLGEENLELLLDELDGLTDEEIRMLLDGETS